MRALALLALFAACRVHPPSGRPECARDSDCGICHDCQRPDRAMCECAEVRCQAGRCALTGCR